MSNMLVFYVKFTYGNSDLAQPWCVELHTSWCLYYTAFPLLIQVLDFPLDYEFFVGYISRIIIFCIITCYVYVECMHSSICRWFMFF